MLCLSLLAGEYFTISDNIVVKVEHVYASRSYVTIDAPRELPIMRGTLLEKNGGKRPDCIRETVPKCRNQLPWNRGKAKALHIMRDTLAQMEDTPEVECLRQQMELLFPKGKKQEKQEKIKQSV